MLTRIVQISVFLVGLPAFHFAAVNQPARKPVDEILKLYVQAIGGEAAVDKIESREVHAERHHGPKLTYYWQKPAKVLLVTGKQKIGYDGGSGWMLSSKKKITKLPKELQLPLEMDANPIRYARLKQLYPDVSAGAPEVVDDRKMDVLVAPNDLGATKFYFDDASHLLARVEDTGEISAYYKHRADFMDYKDVDGVKLPFRIVHSSNEPGAKDEDVRISKVIQNVPITADLFARPRGGTVVLGGKR